MANGPTARSPRSLARPAALLPLLLALLLGLAACSPEGSRDFGDGLGSGADPDNRDDDVQLHGDRARDTRIYYDTPDDRPPVVAE